MIFLEDPNLLFLKTRKTAGTSFEISLSRHATEGDIVTPISAVDEILRRRVGGVFPQNWANTPEAERAFRAAVDTFAASSEGAAAPVFMRRFKKQAVFFNHFGPDIVCPRIGEDRFARALKVTICRHPYDQLVSQAFFRLRHGQADFSVAVDRILEKPHPNSTLYLLEGKPVIDVFLRYETLDADLAALERRTGLDLLSAMPKAKAGFRKDRRPASELLTREQKARCREINRWEFDNLDYAP